MKYVYIGRKEDIESVTKNYNYFSKVTDTELIKDYNNSVNTGIVGVHAQALKLIGLRKVFLERFGKSPIIVEDKIIIGLSGKIRQTKDSYSHLEKVSLIYKDASESDVYLNAVKDTDTDFTDPSKDFDNNSEALLLNIKHGKITTMLNLTNISPYTLLFFDDKLEFCGASYSLNKLRKSYILQTEYKTILFVKYPNNLRLNNIEKLKYEY